MLYYKQEDNRLSGSCQSNRLRLLGHYRMACMSQSALSYGLASWMHPQQSGLPVKKSRKATPLPVKVQEWFFYVRNCLITFGSEK